MNRVLIASANEKAVTLIAPLMRESYPECRLSVCGSAGEARRLCGESDYDLVIINTPLPDERGGELAKDICDSTTAGCLVMTKAENAETLSEQLEEYGALVVARPLSRVLFYQAVKMINASRKRIMGYAKENIKLHKKLDEIKMINRAKLVLMQYLKFSENQAHRYIEKQAMDLRMTKYEIAMKVIKTYDLDA